VGAVGVKEKSEVEGESKLLLEKYAGIIDMLRFFVVTYRYGIVDRIANALSPDAVEVALYDCVRIVKSAYQNRVSAVIKVVEKKRVKKEKKEEKKEEKKREGQAEQEYEEQTIEKTYSVVCCEYDEREGPGIVGEFIDCDKPDLKGKRGYCVPCPQRPSEEELQSFINEVKSDLSIAREVAILAYGRRSRKKEEGEEEE